MLSKCAACGKGGDNLKVCTSCEQVSYCNAKCRNAHRSKHKKECRRLAAEKHNNEAVISIDTHAIIERFSKMEISDEELFADPPPRDDCDICFLPMPHVKSSCGVNASYYPCCGKTVCYGCMLASDIEMRRGTMKDMCAFCRVKLPTHKEYVERAKRRLKLNDANAYHMLGCASRDGDMGLPKDMDKALELFFQAAELGSIEAHFALGHAYHTGRGVSKDLDRTILHWKLAAIGGHGEARCNLGVIEEHNNGNRHRAIKHFIIAACTGQDESLKGVGEGYKAGYVTKAEYTRILRAYRDSRDEIKSEQRARAGPGF